MDIIIRNGVIQQDESMRIFDIKNDEGLLKKNYNTEYVRGHPGPYYDLTDSHIHVSRFPHQIPNFMGPQKHKKIKLEQLPYNNNDKFCCICHCILKQNTAFPNKRKIFESIIHDEYSIENSLTEKINNMCINSNEYNSTINNFNKCKIIENDNIKMWEKIYYSVLKNNFKIKLKELKIEYSNREKRVLNFYYKLVYKLIYRPILYEISYKETKLLYPWELTNYQKFKLNNPKYKKSCIFNTNYNDKFRTNYMIIE